MRRRELAAVETLIFLGTMAGHLRALNRDEGTLDQVLAEQRTMSGFVLVTLAAFLLEPNLHLPWISAVHEAVARPHPELSKRKPRPQPSREFLSQVDRLTAPLEGLPSNMIDRLLYGAADPSFTPGPLPMR